LRAATPAVAGEARPLAADRAPIAEAVAHLVVTGDYLPERVAELVALEADEMEVVVTPRSAVDERHVQGGVPGAEHLDARERRARIRARRDDGERACPEIFDDGGEPEDVPPAGRLHLERRGRQLHEIRERLARARPHDERERREHREPRHRTDPST